MSERQASTYRQSTYTEAHVKACTILSAMGVAYRSEEAFHRHGELTDTGQVKQWIADIHIVDPRFYEGIIEIDGDVHRRPRRSHLDVMKDRFFNERGMWVERMKNKNVITWVMENLLNAHLKPGEKRV